jgi:tetratricopeptide (TPR) repeat protein
VPADESGRRNPAEGAPATGAGGALTPRERRAYQLGRRSFERGDDQTALDHFEEFLRTRRGFADVHYMVGVLFERRDDLQAAARSFARALRINPDYAEARLALASLYERQGDYDRSRELTEQSRARRAAPVGLVDPTTRGKLANLQAALGDAFREAGELREAIEIYRRALDRCPHFHDVRLRLGVALREAGLPDRALSEFRRIQRSHPDYPDAAVQAALTLYTLGRAEEACHEWQALLDREPDNPEAAMYLRLVRRRR